jgi:cellulose 1,4-beta-cellobiosidase
MLKFLVFALCLAVAICQQAGTNTQETHPNLSIQQCTGKQQCTTQQGKVVMDSNWRWLHKVGDTTNCYTGNTWDTTLCPDPQTCSKNCALDGADYQGTYGVTTTGTALNLKFVTNGPYSTNIGSRLYFMDTDTTYKMFHLKNREFTFDVDVSNLPCGLNGALYFVEMDADGGMSKYPLNKAGAKFGTGYCDGQCPHDMKFINGEANVIDWKPNPGDKNAGTGFYGTCCNEMDVWESNSMAAAVTPHVCTVQGQYRCNGTECGDGDNRYGGVCDKDGCDFNSYRMGNQTFLGKGMLIDTTKPFTVVTQWLTNDGTDSGTVSEIKRFYVQNGHVVPNSNSNFSGFKTYNSITDAFCNDQKKFFGDTNDFEKKGGLKGVGQSFEKGMVLVMSLWDDHSVYMLWLDSDYPTNKPATQPGVARGACSTSSGRPDDVEKNSPNSNVIYSNLKYGTIGSTFPSS